VPKPGKLKSTPKPPLNPGSIKSGLKGGLRSKMKAATGRGPVGPQKDYLA